MRFHFPIFLALAVSLLAGPLDSRCSENLSAIGQIHRFEAALDELLPVDAMIEQVTADVFEWSEGPVWVADGAYLVFSDVPANTAWKWSEAAGLEEFLNPSSMADPGNRDPGGQGTNGLHLSLAGSILAGDHGSRSLIRIDPETRVKELLLSKYQGKRFNSPNDLVVSRIRWPGAVFFTDPPYGLKGQDESPLKELDFNGIYRFDPDGTVTLLDRSLRRPNGIALSPDEFTLYVANSDRERAIWMAFDLDDSGAVIGEGRVFASAQDRLEAGAKGLPDGMAVDVEGNIWATGPGGVHVIDPAGRFLGLIESGTAIANCAFGGEERNMLYMTSDGFLARVETHTQDVSSSPVPPGVGMKEEDSRLKALLIDGQMNKHHNMALMSVAITRYLEETGLFEVTHISTPPPGSGLHGFAPDFQSFDLVVLNYDGEEWPGPVKAGFESFMSQGGGLLSVHSTDNAFPDWRAFLDMTGVGGWGGRDENWGPAVYWGESGVAYDHGPGKAFHPSQHEFHITHRDSDHAVTRSLPERWLHAKDELYSGLRGPAQNLSFLASGFADPEFAKKSHRHEPVLLAISYGKGRIFHTTLGHIGKNEKSLPPSTRCAGFITTLQRGAEWAASGTVTQVVPDDFPDSDKVSVRQSE